MKNLIRNILNEVYEYKTKNNIIKECTIAAVRIDDGVVLAKNRDRGYKARVEIIHEIVDGVEVVYWRDIDTDWSEGMNEYGISIVNSALSTASDEKEGEKVLKQRKIKNDKTEKKVYSKDGQKIREALTKKDMRSAVKSLIEFTGTKSKWGLRGETFVSDGKDIYVIEMTSKHAPIIKKLKEDSKIVVRSNHGVYQKDAGYTTGEKRKSSVSRMELAKKHLKDAKTDMDVINTLKQKYDDDPFLNPYRTKNMYNMQTTGQIMMNLDKKLIVVRMDNEMGEFVGIKNKLPKDYSPKIKIKVESEKTHDKGKKLPT
jgi:autotransporter translocation and assembly factor TamB